MDAFTTQALKELGDLLREKVITLAEYRTEVAALQLIARWSLDRKPSSPLHVSRHPLRDKRPGGHHLRPLPPQRSPS